MKKRPNDENKDYYSYFQRGNVRLVTKKYDEAIENYDEAIDRKSNYAPAHNFRGYAYREKGQFDLAIRRLEQSDTAQKRLYRCLY